METKSDWLRSEIEKLEGMRFEDPGDFGNPDDKLIRENWWGCERTLTSIITRYKEELQA